VKRGIDSLLADARSSIVRLTPSEAHSARLGGALLVDTRSPDEQREQGARIVGAAEHPLSVALWRLDELPRETRVILICRHGDSSSLTAAQLRQMGFVDVGDVEGGAEAWIEAGLPVVRTSG
jgi:rhodanese-related sulfurtransferase